MYEAKGHMEEIRERERAKNLFALKLSQGELSYEEQRAYLNELTARVELRLLMWELE
jgi:hypothetical protein